MRTTRLPSLRSTVSVLALAASAAAQSVLSQGQVLMAFGDPIPGVAGATNGGSSPIDNPIIDLEGNVLFRARMIGGGVVATNDRGYMLGRTGSTLQMILRSGDADPTGQLGAGTTLNTATGTGLSGNPRLSPTGGILMFGCSLSGPSIVTTGTAATGNNSTAILWGPVGGLQVLAQRAQSITTPSNSQTYQIDSSLSAPSYQQTALNGSGVACFQVTVIGGDVSGTTNNVGWIRGVPGGLDWVVRKGDVMAIAGGASPGSYPIGTLGFNCAMNQSGQILHDERLSNTLGTPSPATTANDNCVFVYTPGFGNQLLVREGDQAAGVPAGALYGSPTIGQGFGATGQAAFSCQMTGAVTTADDNAMFIGSVGNIQLVHREGTQAPGLPAGVLMGTANSNCSYSDYQGGSVAFYCTLTGTGVTAFNDTSLWLGSPTNLQLIAREGDAAPGFENQPGYVSATFGNTDPATGGGSGIVAGSVQMNDHGQIVFSQCTVTVVDASGTNVRTCSYCWDPITGLKLFASSIDPYTTVSGPQVAFSAGGIQFPSGDSCPLDLNNNGDVVHAAFFPVGTGSGELAIRARIGSMDCSPSALSTATGGSQVMKLDAGVANAGNIYLIAGTASGTRPGFSFGGFTVPLNIDYWFNLSLQAANSAVYTSSFGTLDAQGRATASFNMPPGYPAFAGITINNAYGVIDGGGNVTHVSLPGGILLY
jgi:hypothetical protein